MAAWEPRKEWVISQVSWTDWTAQDVYYWQEHSFQYSANINCDDEMHGIKLANRAWFTSNYAKCQLISCGEHGVMALPIAAESWDEITIKTFQYNWHYPPSWESVWEELISNAWTAISSKYDIVPWVIFQDGISIRSLVGRDWRSRILFYFRLFIFPKQKKLHRKIGI